MWKGRLPPHLWILHSGVGVLVGDRRQWVMGALACACACVGVLSLWVG